jgi:hypothetical protein
MPGSVRLRLRRRRGAEACSRCPHPPTAIFAANDDMALGALTAAQRLGIAVPHDVAIAGFDDSRDGDVSCGPQLTTVRQPLAEMAMAAVDDAAVGRGQARSDGQARARARAAARGGRARLHGGAGEGPGVSALTLRQATVAVTGLQMRHETFAGIALPCAT